ncbi:MAG TPA: M50 family metallopeptidase [Candidatus Limnocylindrales bacterium]|jgi:regulator of sigma E protease
MDLLQNVVTIVLFFLILGTLVVVHELGHFVTARLANVRVLEFGIGFPPRAKVIRSSGETLYTLNWLPIGGFVKLEGEDGDDTDDPRSFVNARLPVRLVILLAGVAMNLLLALAIFLLIAMLATPLYGLRFPQVEPGSPADRAGLEGGDSIISINGTAYDMFGRYVNQVDPITDLRAHAGETITLGVHRKDGRFEELTVTLRPRSEVTETRGPLGVGPSSTEPVLIDYYGRYTGHDPATSARIAVEETGAWFGLIIEGLSNVVRSFVTNPTAPPSGVTGPIGIAQQIGQAFWSFGPIITLYVAGILSANLALVNALPFPPLDGGRMLMIVLKSIFGRRISVQAERVTYFVGFVFLMAFLVWVTWFDIIRGGAT